MPVNKATKDRATLNVEIDALLTWKEYTDDNGDSLHDPKTGDLSISFAPFWQNDSFKQQVLKQFKKIKLKQNQKLERAELGMQSINEVVFEGVRLR